MLENYNAGNHNEEFGAHMQYETYKSRTPKNSGATTPNQWVKLIDRNVYTNEYLAANPVGTVQPPAVNKFNTSFFLYSADTDSSFISAIVTLRVNIYSAYNRYALDVFPLSKGDNLSDAQGHIAYTDLLRLYVQDLGGGKFNVQLYVRYPYSYMTYRIKTLHTSLNDYAWGYSYLDLLSTEYDLWRYSTTEYRLNQWLWIADSSMTLIAESALPTTSSSVLMFPSRNVATSSVGTALPTPSALYDGRFFVLLSGSNKTPYICYEKSGVYYWRPLIDYKPDLLYANGPSGTVRGVTLQTNGIDRFIMRLEDDAETGGNTGSTFALYRRADDGSGLGQVMIVNRATGRVDFQDGVFAVAALWTKPLKLGRWYLWIDEYGEIRKKLDALPISETDGVKLPRYVTTIPTSSNYPGQPGDLAMDANYLYFCYSINTWRRIAASAW